MRRRRKLRPKKKEKKKRRIFKIRKAESLLTIVKGKRSALNGLIRV